MVETSARTLPPQTHPLTLRERQERGRALRKRMAREDNAVWEPPKNRRDPVEILKEQGESRLKDLLPLRYARMRPTPFTFLRGAAAVMAADLATAPSSGLMVQAAGDCHCANFGGFATPERRLVFDINDFDETSVAPWEWDVKRLATSFAVATLGVLPRLGRRELAESVARRYRETLAEIADQPVLEAWYHTLHLDEAGAARKVGIPARAVAAVGDALIHPLNQKSSLNNTGGEIIDDPHHEVYHPEPKKAADFKAKVKACLEEYAHSLSPALQVLLERYRLVDAAYKVVGVGSVGTRCGVMLMMSGNGKSLYLQFKEATQSVLEPHAGLNSCPNHGQRVVFGQRLLQGASDMLLGWSTWGTHRHVYLRQLRDANIKLDVEAMSARNLQRYAESCGEVLARAHARSADAVLLTAYLGGSPAFDEAIGAFAGAYAGQTERDHEALKKAIKNKDLPCQAED